MDAQEVSNGSAARQDQEVDDAADQMTTASSPSGQTSTAYDELPYPSVARRSSHPERMAVLAAIFGLSCRSIFDCSVLELGCSTAGNLLPMASALPTSRFVGVDLSARQIAEGQVLVDSLHLSNVQLIHADITHLPPQLGTFDYIICHGLYSWVDATVQSAILTQCKKLLSPNGVAFVSYNVYPGWHMRETLRRLMQFRARLFQDAERKVEQGLALLRWLASHQLNHDVAYGAFLQQSLRQMGKESASYLFHDYLEENNRPCYFHEFVDQARAHGLQYIADTNFSAMYATEFPPHTKRALQAMCGDRLQLEQHLDFLRNRPFRESLLCHQDVALRVAADATALRGFHFSSQFPQIPQFLTSLLGDTALITILLLLRRAWPGRLTFGQLQQRSGLPATRLQSALAVGCEHGIVEPYLFPALYASWIPQRPQATAVARYEAERGGLVTTLKHQSAKLSSLQGKVLGWLDGSRDQAQITAELVRLAQSGQLMLHQDQQAVTDEKFRDQFLANAVNRVLQELTNLCLLLRS